MIVVRCDYCNRFHDDGSYQAHLPPAPYPYAALAHLPGGWEIQFDPARAQFQITCRHCREERGDRVHHV